MQWIVFSTASNRTFASQLQPHLSVCICSVLWIGRCVSPPPAGGWRSSHSTRHTRRHSSPRRSCAARTRYALCSDGGVVAMVVMEQSTKDVLIVRWEVTKANRQTNKLLYFRQKLILIFQINLLLFMYTNIYRHIEIWNLLFFRW